MIRDANAVEPQVAVEVNHLGRGQLAIRIVGVNVEIAEQHFGFAAQLRRARHDRASVRFEERYFFPGFGMVTASDDQFGNPERSVWAADFGEILTPFAPAACLPSKGLFHSLRHFLALLRDYPNS